MCCESLRKLPPSIVEKIISKMIGFVESNSSYFLELESVFPIYGSKIDWDNVPGMVEKKIENLNSPCESLCFLKRNMPTNPHYSEIIFIGDSAINCALKLPRQILFAEWDALYTLPQHHYLMPEDFTWCISITLEGYMNFGYSPILR